MMDNVPFKIAKSFEEILNDKNNTLYELFIIPRKGYKVKRILCKCAINVSWRNRMLQIFTYDRFGRVSGGYNNYYLVNIENINLNNDIIEYNHVGDIFTLSRDKAYNITMSNLRQMIKELRKKEMIIHEQIYTV